MNEFFDFHINGQLYLYFSNKVEDENFYIVYSDIIDDQYWNLAYLKDNKVDLKDIYNKVKVYMKKLNRKPLIYVTSDILNTELNKQIKDCNLKELYTDVWMTIDDINSFGEYESNLDFSVNKVGENLKEVFIQAIMDGFSGENPEDPYESLSEGYRIALRESFFGNGSDYKVSHYLGLYKDEAISTATVIYNKNKAIIYNVTTNKKYQKQGVCKRMMSEVMSELKNLGITSVCLQTEKGFYTEQVYKNMGFKEFMLGKGYTE